MTMKALVEVGPGVGVLVAVGVGIADDEHEHPLTIPIVSAAQSAVANQIWPLTVHFSFTRFGRL